MTTEERLKALETLNEIVDIRKSNPEFMWE